MPFHKKNISSNRRLSPEVGWQANCLPPNFGSMDKLFVSAADYAKRESVPYHKAAKAWRKIQEELVAAEGTRGLEKFRKKIYRERQWRTLQRAELRYPGLVMFLVLPSVNLSEVARKYRVSRERIRQLKKIWNWCSLTKNG